MNEKRGPEAANPFQEKAGRPSPAASALSPGGLAVKRARCTR